MRGDLINIYKDGKGGIKRVEGARICLVVPSNRTSSNGQKLMHKKFHLIMRKNIFTIQVTLWSFPNLLILSFCDSLQNLVAQVPEAHWEEELLFLPLPKVKESVYIFLGASDPVYGSVSVL